MSMKPIMEGWRGYLSEQEELNINKFVNDVLADIQKSGLADQANIKSKTGKSAIITNTGSRKNRKNIIDLLNKKGYRTEIGTATDGSGLYKIGLLDSSNSLRYIILLKQGSVDKGSSPNSTAFEENLANALNEVGGACKTQFAGAGSQFDPLALEIVKSFSNSYNLKGCMEKMPQGGVAVSDDYAKYGVKSREPKTDLISKDGKIRISVKKSTSQIISAQGGETAAVFMAVLKNIQYKNIDLGEKMSQLIKKYFSHEQGISDLKSLSPNERKKAKVKRNFLLQRIKNFGGSTLNYYLVREALLGEYKFSGGADDPAVPNYFLVWDDNGTGKFYEAEKFVKSVASRIKFGVRGRGGTRGLAFRGDKSK